MAGDVKVAVVSGKISAGGSGTADFTKSGFGTPLACIVLLSDDPTDDANVQAKSSASIGFSDFTNNYSITHQDEDNSAKVDCDARKSNTDSYALVTFAGLIGVQGTASTITDGVRLTNSNNDEGISPFATIIMFGGADLKVSLDRTTVNSSQNGTATITPGTGFDTSLIFFIGTDVAGENSVNSGINNSFGVCHINAPTYDTFTQRCMGWASDHNNVAGSPSAVISTDRVLDILDETAGQDWGLEVTAAATNSITVTTRDNGAGAGMEVYSLALDIDDRKVKVGSVDSPTSGATWTPSVSLGFTPQYVGLLLTNLPSEDTIDSGADSGALGISSNTGAGEETCHSWYNEDANETTNTNNLFRSRAIDFRDDDVTTVNQDHTHSSFNDGDWTTTIITENEAAASKWGFWAIEEAAAADPSADTVLFMPGQHQPVIEPPQVVGY